MQKNLLKIRRALISVSNKSNILKLAHALSQYNIQLLTSTGTSKQLKKSGLQTTEISKYTGFPEIMDGRIKTLHTKIYAGILGRPGIDDDIMKTHSIKPIDMVVINFYPYLSSSTRSKPENIQINNTNDILLTDNIDIGGPSLVRSAAKNYKNVAVIENNHDYIKIINELKINNGQISIQTRLKLAITAFQYVAIYDDLIAKNFKKQLSKNKKKHNTKFNIHFPDYINCINTNFIKKENMRYGENPHQSAAFYVKTQNLKHDSISRAQQLQGKKLSYNNIIDIDTALECVKTFVKPTCVIVKHAIPCGVASAQTILQAYKKAYQTDPTSTFGGILAFNKNLDENTTRTIINQQFIEAIIAPSIDQNSLKILNNKKNIRILTFKLSSKKITQNISLDLDFKCINGGLLIQNKDINNTINIKNINIVTKREPTNKEINDALFCWKIVKFVKSNAIVYARNEQTIGIGSGQTSRIYAAEIAILKAKKSEIKLKQGTVMASDAFLPFPDTIKISASIGTTCIIQPGGSIQDKQIINYANEQNISMIFTHTRHFRH